MTVTYADPVPGVDVIGLPWERFLAYMRDTWKPGQHIAMIGPTGEGKTTFAAGLLSIRKWVMALDPKGEDETLTKSEMHAVAGLTVIGECGEQHHAGGLGFHAIDDALLRADEGNKF